jgi:GNAT superfamily N-acetyltransferase
MPLMDPPEVLGRSPPTMKRLSRFFVSPATTDDVRRLVDIEFHAFENERVNHALSYRDHNNPNHLERTVQLYTTAMQQAKKQQSEAQPETTQRSDSVMETLPSSLTVKFLKVTDIETGEIVSFAKTETKTYGLKELASPADSGHEGEAQMNRDWFAVNERLRREYVGLAKHCCKHHAASFVLREHTLTRAIDIGMLATEPRFQHNGAATMLLQAILSEADKAGLECYLEGTDTAKQLYLKHGFQPVNDIYFDPAEYGVLGLGIEHQTVMVRGALGKDGGRRQARAWEIAVAQSKTELEHVN